MSDWWTYFHEIYWSYFHTFTSLFACICWVSTVSFIAAQAAPRQPNLSLKAEAPGMGGAQLCQAPNTEMQTNDGCALLCEKNMTDPKDHAKFKQLETADPRMLCDPDFCKCFDPKTPKQQFVNRVQVI